MCNISPWWLNEGSTMIPSVKKQERFYFVFKSKSSAVSSFPTGTFDNPRRLQHKCGDDSWRCVCRGEGATPRCGGVKATSTVYDPHPLPFLPSFRGLQEMRCSSLWSPLWCLQTFPSCPIKSHQSARTETSSVAAVCLLLQPLRTVSGGRLPTARHIPSPGVEVAWQCSALLPSSSCNPPTAPPPLLHTNGQEEDW